MQVRPDQIVQELFEFNRKISSGISCLGQVGEVDVGTAPKEAVYGEGKMTLYHYTPQVANPAKVPVLVVYGLVNRPYMTDLQPDRSLIRGLLGHGVDVYLIDWGYPDGADRYLDLDDYINGYVHRSVQHICKQHGLPSINILGICQGGTFSLCYSAMHPEKVQNLITMVTPIDFHTPGNILAHWARQLDVDTMVDTLGNIPGELLNWCFLSIKPFRLTGQKYIDMADIMEDPQKLKNFLRMEKWIFDSPDQAGEAFRQFVKNFFQENRLLKGGLKIGERSVELKNISMPVLNIYATEDHLVPPPASTILGKCVGTKDYSEFTFNGGHIGIYVSGRAQKDIPAAIAKWLKERCH